MITRDRAIELSGSNHELYHVTLRTRAGASVRIRVNGRVQLWKTRPDEFRLPCKHGLREWYQLDQTNAHEWIETDLGQQEVNKAREAKRVQQQEERDRKEAERKAKEHKRNAHKVGLPEETPESIIRDAMIDKGLLVEVA